jgi:hypothetical protein
MCLEHANRDSCAVLESGLPLPITGPYGPEAHFTMPPFWAFIGGLRGLCVHMPPGACRPRQCSKGDVNAGVQCQSPACGRPADWPEGSPFYIAIDLLDTATWDRYILGNRAARQLAGKPTEPSAAERRHIKVWLQLPSTFAHVLHLSSRAPYECSMPTGFQEAAIIDRGQPQAVSFLDTLLPHRG